MTAFSSVSAQGEVLVQHSHISPFKVLTVTAYYECFRLPWRMPCVLNRTPRLAKAGVSDSRDQARFYRKPPVGAVFDRVFTAFPLRYSQRPGVQDHHGRGSVILSTVFAAVDDPGGQFFEGSATVLP